MNLVRLKRKVIIKILAGIFIAISAVIFHLIGGSQQLNPQVIRPTIPASLFGIHIHRIYGHPESITPWPSVPFATWRLWDARVSWPHLEPSKGTWNFETLDSYVNAASQHQVEILLPLGLSPAWASARPTEPSAYPSPMGLGWAAEPNNLEDWRNYVRTVATRYKGRIQYYEIWNEPNVQRFFSGSVPQLVTLAKEAYQILKQIDPEIQVISPAATGGDNGDDWVDGPSWLDEFLTQGGKEFVDIIGYHFYVIPQPPEAMVPLVARVKTVMAKHHLNEKELWNTETGWSLPKVFSLPGEAAGYVARSYILMGSSGVTRFYWYAWDNHKGVSLEMTAADSETLEPAAIAYQEVQKWLVGAQLNECLESKNGWQCQLQRQGNYTAWILWNPYGSLMFNVPKNWQITHVRNLADDVQIWDGDRVPIGQSPILLEHKT